MSYSSCSCFCLLDRTIKFVYLVLEQFKFGSLSTILSYWPLDVQHGTSWQRTFWGKKGKGKGSGVWPSMVTHTRNLSSAFNPSKCTLTAVNTHLVQWAAILRRPGSSWGIGALLKGLTSVVVLRVERALVIHSPHRQSLPDLRFEPATFGLQVQLSNH